jgi:hypothetical protein
MTTTLFTWVCGHFCFAEFPSYQPEKALLQAVRENFWFLADRAHEDLSEVVNNHHFASCENCPKCQEPVSVSFWRVRADEGIRDLRNIHACMKRMYLAYGGQHATLDFSQKARYAHDDRCAAVHEQFWISKTPRHQDQWFAPMEEILYLCDQADLLLKDSKTHADVKAVFVHVNNARAKVGSLVAPLEDLQSGVRSISEVGSRDIDIEQGKKRTKLKDRENMLSGFKELSWFNRMEDWRDEAVDAKYRAQADKSILEEEERS